MSTSTARAAIYETVQFGVEGAATPGTAVAANLKFPHTTMSGKPVVETEDVEEQGGKGPTDVIVGKEMSTLSASGIVNCSDLLYFLASAVCRPTVTGAVSEMIINQYGSDDKLTMTAEMGGAAGRSRVAGVQSKSLEITLSEDKAPRYSVELFGRKWDDSISALTASPTRLATSPFGPKGVSVYIADTLAGLDVSGNKLDKGFLLNCSLKIDAVADHIFGIEDVESYSTVVDEKPVVTMPIAVEQNTRGDGYMAKLRSEAQMYGRIRMVGRTIGGTQSRIEIDFPFQFKEPDRSEVRKIFSGSYICRANYDGTGTGKLGTMLRIRVTQAAVGSTQTLELKQTATVQTP